MSLLSDFIKILAIPLHAFSHENNGTDEINVAGLSGELADAQTPKTHAASHKSAGGDSIKLDELAAPTDVTTLNASTGAHGLLPKLNNVSTNFLNGQGNWATPSSTPPASSVGQSQLKTTVGDTFVGSGGGIHVVLPGGEYGFYPVYFTSSGSGPVTVQIMSGYTVGTIAVSTVYITIVNATTVRQRYVTASGTDWWFFYLRQKYTGEILSIWSAPDHPSHNYADNCDAVPHPFINYDPDIHEIFVINKAKVTEMKQLTDPEGMLELARSMEVGAEAAYVPLHTGRYINGQPEMVNTLPAYIKCRTLIGPSSSSSSA